MLEKITTEEARKRIINKDNTLFIHYIEEENLQDSLFFHGFSNVLPIIVFKDATWDSYQQLHDQLNIAIKTVRAISTTEPKRRVVLVQDGENEAVFLNKIHQLRIIVEAERQIKKDLHV